jgi:hypothetical protein
MNRWSLQSTTTTAAARVLRCCAGAATALIVQLALLPAITHAQANAKDAGPEVWRMTIHPQATPRPALKYVLYPSLADETPGNAASSYMLAFGRAQDVPETPADKAVTSKSLPAPENPDALSYFLEEVPLDRLPGQDVENYLANWTSSFDLLAIATRRDHCRWDLALREQGFEMLLPQLNPARVLSRATALRARLHIANKQYDQAAADVARIMRLGHDIASEGAIVQTLVGSAIVSTGAGQVREMVQQRGAPNLYFSIANLPRPLMDARTPLEWERVALLGSLPQLRKAESQPLTADDWRDLVERLGRLGPIMSDTHGVLGKGADVRGIAPAAAGAMLYPEAKRALVERGLVADAAAADALSVPDVLGKYLVIEYRTWFDEISKWTAAPFWQSHEGMRRAEAELSKVKGRPILSPVLAGVPAVSKFSLQLARMDRQLAVLQTLEALRAYAASHDGKLPASLDELAATDTPAAQDPTTGKPFAYRVEGDGRGATLESPAPTGESPKAGLRVEVTLEK